MFVQRYIGRGVDVADDLNGVVESVVVVALCGREDVVGVESVEKLEVGLWLKEFYSFLIIYLL